MKTIFNSDLKSMDILHGPEQVYTSLDEKVAVWTEDELSSRNPVIESAEYAYKVSSTPLDRCQT